MNRRQHPPLKRLPRSVEHQEAAEEQAWDQGFDVGYQAGRDQAMYDKGHEDGYNAGVADASCKSYDAGYQDAKTGKPPKHEPHTWLENATELIQDEPHE